MALLAAIVLSACSQQAHGDSTGVQQFDETIDQAIEEARDGGANEAQLELLERAKEQGAVTYEDARVAATAALECMAQRGIEGTFSDSTLPNGVTIPSYTVVADRPDAEQVMDECSYQNDFWVNKLYQLQPLSIEANNAFIDAQRPVIVACLAEAGFVVADDATLDELLEVADQAREERGATCLVDAGVVSH